MDEPTCIDETLGRQLFRRSTLPMGSGELSESLERHAAECPYCAKNVGAWRKKGYFAVRMAEARHIIAESAVAGTSVHTRSLRSQRLYFKASERVAEHGVMIVTNDLGVITQIDDVAKSVFDSFQ